MGIPVKAPLTPQPLSIRAADASGNVSTRTVEVQILDGEFLFGGRVNLSPGLSQMMDERDQYLEARGLREKAYAHEDDEALWDGPFLRPTEGDITSPYGHYRVYSNGEEDHHDAIDISDVLGTPIYAAARGEVRIARNLHTYGNCVVLVHGQGVTTTYNHMQDLAVEEGGIVEAGTLLGHMGSTGLSTGSHLHWGLVVYSNGTVAVDASQWETDDFSQLDALVFQ